MKKNLGVIIFLLGGLYFIASPLSASVLKKTSLGLQTGFGNQYSIAGDNLGINPGTELRFNFNSYFIAHSELNLALVEERVSNFDMLTGLLVRIPFGGRHSLDFGGGSDSPNFFGAAFITMFGLFLAALSQGNNSGSSNGVGDLYSKVGDHKVGGYRLFGQTSYRYRFNRVVAGFVKAQHVRRGNRAGGFRSSSVVFFGAEFFLYGHR